MAFKGSNVVFGLLVVVLISSVVGSFWNSLFSNYSVTFGENDDFEQYNRLDSVLSIIDTVSSRLKSVKNSNLASFVISVPIGIIEVLYLTLAAMDPLVFVLDTFFGISGFPPIFSTVVSAWVGYNFYVWIMGILGKSNEV